MRNKNTKNPVCFRRWTRKNYAVFNSLGRQIKIGVLSTSLSLVTLSAQQVSAQDTTAQAVAREHETPAVPIEEIVVTGDKTLSIAEPARVVAVITRIDIERAAVQNIQDLLRYVDGVDVRTRGSNNVQADVSFRGGTFDQTVVLLNGVNITDPQTGHHSLNIPVNLEDVQRIEVLQGPGAWTMGAVTYSGAINIITKLENQTGVSAGAIGGMHNYQSYSAAGNVAAKGLRATVSANKSKSDGYTDNTDFDVDNVYAQLRYATPKSGGLSGQFGYQNKDFGAHSFYGADYPYQHEHTRTFLSSLRYDIEKGNWGAALTLHHRQHQDQYDLYHINPPSWYTGHNYHRTDIAGALAQLTRSGKLGTTTAGFSYRYEHIYSNTLGETMQTPIAVKGENDIFYTREKAREHYSASLQHAFHVQKFHATLGVMGAGNNDFGFRAYAGGNVAYDLAPAWQLSAAASNDYRLPTFTDLYYNVGKQKGNINLKPEEAVTGELGLRYREQTWRASATGFYRYGYNIINWLLNTSDSIWYAQNITNVATSGVNLQAEYAPQGQVLKKIAIGYTYLHATPSEQAETKSYVIEQLSHRLTATLQHGIWRQLAASWQVLSQQRAGGYDPFWLCDLKIYWEAKRYNIFTEATNLFNATYSDFGYIPQPGRWVKAGITVKIN